MILNCNGKGGRGKKDEKWRKCSKRFVYVSTAFWNIILQQEKKAQKKKNKRRRRKDSEGLRVRQEENVAGLGGWGIDELLGAEQKEGFKSSTKLYAEAFNY